MENGAPPYTEEEIRWEEFGALRVGFADRRTLIALKLLAAVDQGPESAHYADLIALEPTAEELAEARDWAEAQDRGDHHGDFIEAVIDHVRRDLGRDG